MVEMKIDVKEQGDIGDQMKILTEKMLSHDEYLRFMDERVTKNQQMAESIKNNSETGLANLQENLSSFISQTE